MFLHPVSRHSQARRQGDAGGVAVRDAVAGPDPAPQRVREAHRGVERPEVREPGGDLQLQAHLDVLRPLPGTWQVSQEAAGTLEPGHVGDGMLPAEEEPLHGVVESPDAGREPELLRGEVGGLRVEYHYRRDGFGVREATLAPRRLVGNPHAVRPLDGAPRCVLAHGRIGARVLLPKHRLDALDESSLLVEGAPGDDEGLLRRLGLFLYLLQAPGAEVYSFGRKEGVRAASHGTMVSTHAAPCEPGSSLEAASLALCRACAAARAAALAPPRRERRSARRSVPRAPARPRQTTAGPRPSGRDGWRDPAGGGRSNLDPPSCPEAGKRC